ncbi:hypothetical protein PF003_g7812 [Phytophthora fragariae]|nr:hypothetical protein PF003_g7812 [Phytophthora fragariae]
MRNHPARYNAERDVAWSPLACARAISDSVATRRVLAVATDPSSSWICVVPRRSSSA